MGLPPQQARCRRRYPVHTSGEIQGIDVAVSLSYNPAQSQTVIAISGAFTQALRPKFFQAVAAVPDRVRELVIDLSETDELDASAMGMLMLLRDKHPSSATIILLAPDSPIEPFLRTANFHQLFAIETAV